MFKMSLLIMTKGNKIYWKGVEQLKNDPSFVKNAHNEFPEHLPINGSSDNSRRDFLKMMGFGIAAVSTVACEAPVKYAIPYVNKPVDVDVSIPNYYASSFTMGSDYCSVVVKTREGRPIKIDGNTYSKVSGGATTPRVESSILTLYDKQRLKGPMLNNKEANWSEIDKFVNENLSNSKNTYIISNSISSPSTRGVINDFLKKNNGKHVEYDAVSYDGMLDANKEHFNKRKLPSYDFSKAKTIVSFGSDFLGSSFNSSLFNKQFAQTRKVNAKNREMSRLYSFESNLSLTGSNADHRIPIKSSQAPLYIVGLYNTISKKLNKTSFVKNFIDIEESVLGKVGNEIKSDILNTVADELIENKGKSIVISNSNDKHVQSVVNMMNIMLGNYGNTIDTKNWYNIRNGSDSEMASFIDDINNKKVGAVIFLNCNPVYDHFASAYLKESLSSIPLRISTSDRIDETSILCNVIATDSHFLESWNDFEPIENSYSFSQPTIRNIFDTRQSQDSLLRWSGSKTNYFEVLKSNWREKQKLTNSNEPFQMFWDRLIRDGVAEFLSSNNKKEPKISAKVNFENTYAGMKKVLNSMNSNEAFEINIYLNSSVGDGVQANNPWLHEMPDPISKVCWDNYLSVNPKDANKLNLKTDSGVMSTNLLLIKLNGSEFEIPAIIQPGQAEGTIGLALGYGRKLAGPVGDNVGFNAYSLIDSSNKNQNLVISNVSVSNSGKDYRIAQTQTHQTIMARESVIQETTLDEYKKDVYAGKYQFKVATSQGKKKPEEVTLWDGHEYPNHHWVMSVDLNACTGCGACTVACQVENNVPVVGKEEVLNRREMAWLRIDRYYSSDADVDDLQGLEIAAENPEVTFQPMMCQHCNNAPCETVCPVAATTHSTEGLNQMTYNRCIGTRYCANNCPYKVRRFNWFKYHDNAQFDKNISMNNDLGKMVLNPDVTVRSRGVMEKCSFCVQKIQQGKLVARSEKRELKDGDVSTACSTACPTGAITFGDVNDKNSDIRNLLKVEKIDKSTLKLKEERAYAVLDEIRVSPNVWYLRKVRNKKNS